VGPTSVADDSFFLMLFACAILMDGANYLFTKPSPATAIWGLSVTAATALSVLIMCVSFLVFLSRRGLYPRYRKGRDSDRGRFYWMVEGATAHSGQSLYLAKYPDWAKLFLILWSST